MRLGIVGLGTMGANMAERVRQGGHEVVGFDHNPDHRDVGSLAELVQALDQPPRVVWSMVPAGDPTEAVVSELAGLLSEGDVIVDGGNSKYLDSARRAEAVAEKGIGFIDCGTSGGVWGRENGYCLMVGGSQDDVAKVQPVFDALRPADGGFAHVGPVGTGHYTKMIHNGIEYGLMQAYAEGYAILDAVDMELDALAAFKAWRHGSVVRSWLLDLLAAALEENPGLEGIRGRAADSGEGRWTIDEAVRLAVPAPVISSALFARFASRIDDDPAMKVIAALRNQFGGHAVELHE
ncbi:MAG: phosphogluconate dehydrogenase (NAD(+)-dependent, decarboxylating) [Actinomycetota bacterium]